MPVDLEKGLHGTPIGRKSFAEENVEFGWRSIHLGVWEGF